MSVQKNILSFFIFFMSYSYSNELKLEWQSYISPPSLNEQFSDYVFMKGNYQNSVKKEDFYFSSKFLFQYSLYNSKFFYFGIPEIYFNYKYFLENDFYSIKSIQVSLGRQVKNWSFGDQYWDLGLWNSLNRWNPLYPIDNGLIGSFFTFTSDWWESNFFIGAFYLPDQDIKFVIEDGHIYSQSRWSNVLPKKVEKLNTDIFYYNDAPFIFDTLLQQSFLFSFKTWSNFSKEGFYWIKGAFANKPSNNLFYVLKVKDRLEIERKKEGSFFVNQGISVFPVRQRILSTEWGLDYKKSSLIVSFENTNMKSESPLPKDWEFVRDQSNFTYFSLLFKYNYLEDSFFRLAFIQSWFTDGILSKELSSFIQRGKILEGIGFDWQTKFFINQPLHLNLKYQYSFLDEGAWLSVRSIYYISPKIYTELGIDIVGSVSKSINESFLKKFKHNDYFTWSLVYDF
ncbi:MAG: hypothetical protein OXC37_02990 [Bdellovibrionaceae bacterium]|nr:hypothetical protein [Pseudobdellovibrionaceae bacterium]